VRRGITYGKRAKNPDGSTRFDDLPDGPVGLLFMCFQRDITQQFEFIQQSWLNYTNIGIGLDPVAGQSSGKTPPQRWPSVWGESPSVALDLNKVVTLKGGEYFFAPSKPFLRSV
jgi:deferrochelatase/peroxidase EfeB